APAFSPSPCSFTAMLKPGLLGFSGAKMAPAPILSASRIRQVPRIAPRILLSSKEFIERRLPGRGVRCGRMPPGCGGGDEIPVCLAHGNPYKRLQHYRHSPCGPAVPAIISMPDAIILIPARLASTRLPGKPLADLNGAPMIVHVLRRAQAAKIGE